MKKTIKKIALVLFLLMLVNSFSSCFTMWAFEQKEIETWFLIFPIPLFPALDIVSAPIQLIIFLVELDKSKELKQKAMEMDGMDTFSTDKYFVPRSNLISLSNKINSLPEEKITIFTNTVNSFSETEIAAIIKAYYNLSEEEVNSSIETLNSLPDETLIAVMNNSRYTEFRQMN